MFGRKNIEDQMPLPSVKLGPLGSVVVSQEIEYRPCYVNGRKALFHRWVNTANPTLPKGVDPDDERVRFFQHRSTTGLVEYEDGTMARVWPQEIRFADSDKRFREHAWPSAEKTEALK